METMFRRSGPSLISKKHIGFLVSVAIWFCYNSSVLAEEILLTCEGDEFISQPFAINGKGSYTIRKVPYIVKINFTPGFSSPYVCLNNHCFNNYYLNRMRWNVYETSSDYSGLFVRDDDGLSGSQYSSFKLDRISGALTFELIMRGGFKKDSEAITFDLSFRGTCRKAQTKF